MWVIKRQIFGADWKYIFKNETLKFMFFYSWKNKMYIALITAFSIFYVYVEWNQKFQIVFLYWGCNVFMKKM